MLISLFLQTITQANENHYQASKNMFKVSNKKGQKGAEATIRRCSLKKLFLKNCQKAWKTPGEEFVFSKVVGCGLKACDCRLKVCNVIKINPFTGVIIQKFLSVKSHIIQKLALHCKSTWELVSIECKCLLKGIFKEK